MTRLAYAKLVESSPCSWALGVVLEVLYELLTDKLPFEGDSMASIAVAVVHTCGPWNATPSLVQL